MPAVRKLEGQIFGKLTVIRKVSSPKRGMSPVWECRCICGRVIHTRAEYLIRGSTQSCGCLRKNQEEVKYLIPPLQLLYKYMKTRVTTRSDRYQRSFILTLEEFLSIVTADCHYCGISPSQEFILKRVRDSIAIYNGIDRKNNTLGYELSNCVPCCGTCNVMKGVLSYDKFILQLKLISIHQRF